MRRMVDVDELIMHKRKAKFFGLRPDVERVGFAVPVEEIEKVSSQLEKPLSDAELEEMNGKPVWCAELNLWAILSIERGGRWDGIPFINGVDGLDRGVAVPFSYIVKQHGYTLYRFPPKGEGHGE